jgi:hypothetical protein
MSSVHFLKVHVHLVLHSSRLQANANFGSALANVWIAFVLALGHHFLDHAIGSVHRFSPSQSAVLADFAARNLWNKMINELENQLKAINLRHP